MQDVDSLSDVSLATLKDRSVPKFAVLVCMAYGLALVVFIVRNLEFGRAIGWLLFCWEIARLRCLACAVSPFSATTRTALRVGLSEDIESCSDGLVTFASWS